MNTVCYLAIYVFEQFISYMYFNNKYKSNKKPYILIMCFFASFLIQFSLNFLAVPMLNLLSFFVCNFIISKVCFDVNIKSTVFSVVLLAGLMLTTELLVMFSFSALSDNGILNYTDNPYSMLFQTIATKSLYFFAVYFLSRYSSKDRLVKKSGDFSLLFLPMVSIATSVIFNQLIQTLELDNSVYISFAAISFVLLFSNVLVFIIHEKVVSALLQYQLELQKGEINRRYYNELERQQENSNILIHDIKKHLTVIKKLAQDDECYSVEKYINSVYEDNGIQELKQYSSNKLINVIVSRYVDLCRRENIDITVDIRNVDFSFISESELTALFDNLLENAYEAAKSSEHHYINVSVDKKNEQYIIFYIVNSCDVSPNINGKSFITSKKDKSYHGFGLKSINKIAKKYQGNAEFRYDEMSKSFISSVLLKATDNN